jgi:hypothetical protein
MVKRRKAPAGGLVVSRAEVARVPVTRISWKATYRLVLSKYPPIDLFERIAPRSDWHALAELEGLTNPRLREAAGNIRSIPQAKIVTGPGASIVMAPFAHHSPRRPSRFSDGTYGVYYAGRTFTTALLEVTFHMARFHAATKDPALVETYRSYKGSLRKPMHDIRGRGFDHLLSKDVADYQRSQSLAAALRTADSNGIVYPSVRHAGGECLAAFWPNVVAIPVQDQHVHVRWDGTAISAWFGSASERIRAAPEWQPLPG